MNATLGRVLAGTGNAFLALNASANVALYEPSEGEIEGTSVEVVCDGADIACAVANLFIALALSGLTGVKASIPIFFVALGAKLFDDFPLTLAGESEWLESWPTIIGLFFFMVGEVFGDCIPGIDELMDAVMLVLKPAIGIVLALAPFYTEAKAVSFLFKVVAALLGGLLTEIIALTKAVETLAVDTASVGLCAPVRSLAEDSVAFVGVAFVLLFGAVFAAFVIFMLLVATVYWARKRKRQGKPAFPRPRFPPCVLWCCPLLWWCPGGPCGPKASTTACWETDYESSEPGSDSASIEGS